MCCHWGDFDKFFDWEHDGRQTGKVIALRFQDFPHALQNFKVSRDNE